MTSPISRLSVLTWNVWFDSLQRRARYDEVFKICRTLAPDVICFQEATPFFLSMLKEDPIRDSYSLSDNMGSYINPYGVLSLCRKDLASSFIHTEMPTDMNRMLLTTNIQTDAGEFSIGNVHLESLDSASTRREQLQVCSRTLTASGASILCGDFNFCSDRNYHPERVPLENDTLQQVLPRFVDVWPTLRHPTDRGYTFDTVANRMLTDNHQHEQFRFDRMMFNAPGGKWVASSIQMVGNLPLGENVPALEGGAVSRESAAPPPAHPAPTGLFSFLTPVKTKKPIEQMPLFPSDHFGLFAVFDRAL